MLCDEEESAALEWVPIAGAVKLRGAGVNIVLQLSLNTAVTSVGFELANSTTFPTKRELGLLTKRERGAGSLTVGAQQSDFINLRPLLVYSTIANIVNPQVSNSDSRCNVHSSV